MSGITEYGYERKTLPEILSSLKQNLRSKLGEDWNIATGSVEDQFISIFAEELDQCYQGLEGVIASNTIDGAEGIYLDDVLSRQGVYRKGRTASSGKGIVFSDYATVTLGSVINTTTSVTANNGLTYVNTESRTIDNFMSCYKLSAGQLSIGQAYTFSIYNTTSTSTRTFEWTVSSEPSKDLMLIELARFCNEVVLNRPTDAYYEPTTRTMYLGFNAATNLPQPFPKGTLYVQSTPRVGSLGHTLELRSNTLGFNPLSANGLTALSPTYVGYQSVQNGDDFNSGTEVQTDAEYRTSALNVKDSSIAGTPDSIVSGLLGLDGVIDAVVYTNPTENFIYDVSSNLVANPYTYNVAVLGGDDFEVAQVIYDKSPANTQRIGDYTSTAVDYKGTTVNVNFTRCSYFDVAIQVSYKTRDNTALTETEKSNISNNLVTVISQLIIGDTIPTSLLQSVVFQSVSFGKLRTVIIQIKDLTDGGATFTADDITADYDEKPRVLLDQISYIRV